MATDPLIELTKEVAAIAAAADVSTAVIGAAAMARYQHVRATADIDLGSCVAASKLRIIRDAAESKFGRDRVVLREESDPSADLNGVLDVHLTPDSLELVQIVNFPEHLQIARNAVANATPAIGLRFATLVDLVWLKLYAGGPNDMLDVIALMERNADEGLSLASLERECPKHLRRNLGKLANVLGTPLPKATPRTKPRRVRTRPSRGRP